MLEIKENNIIEDVIKIESSKKCYSEPTLENIGDVNGVTKGGFGTESDGASHQPPISQN